MTQFDLFQARSRKVYSVSELTREIKGHLEGRFSALWVQGEVSNLRPASAGHVYFTLKDLDATLRVVLFRSQARLLRFQVRDGMKVLCRGRLTVYEQKGEYQLVAETVEPQGAGALMLAFEQLKKKLAAEGLFDQAKKRKPPFLPRRIGVVTSLRGAAIRDFLRVLHRRHPGLAVLVAPARVQGDGAAAEIAAGVRALGRRCDVVVVTRGGGSIEDLWAFNEEVVARAIAACPVPVVSAVGHEVDFTIADFAADVRAPTPTGAAELLAPVRAELVEALAVRERRLVRAMEAVLRERRGDVRELWARLGDPRRRLAGERLALDARADRLADALRARIWRGRGALRALEERLERGHPRARLRAHAAALARLGERLHAGLRVALSARRQALGRLSDRLARRDARLLVARERHRLHELAARLGRFSPRATVESGFALALLLPGEEAVRDAARLQKGDRLHLELARGAVEVEVIGPRPAKKDGWVVE